MTISGFVKAYYKYAKETEEKTGISAVAILAQAALESGWGKVAPGNMFFGVKDTDGINGNEQLLLTTEYSRNANLKFPQIISITPITIKGLPYYKYRVRDYFRKYDTPEQSFTDHANFFIRNKRYANALKFKHNCRQFLVKVAEAGYATDPDYKNKMLKMCDLIENAIDKYIK